jgi:hypothetical protein
MDKREERYWKKFENSGKIEDYLSFVSGNGQKMTNVSGWVKEGKNAGIYMCNGNDTETVPGGGVRQAYQPFD